MLDTFRAVWNQKPVLRAIYSDYFDRIANRCGPGPTLEIGGGIGSLRDKIPGLIASDIQFAPWLDLVADAQRLPFVDGSLGNIVMLDVLHHVEFPALFFREASRKLRSGGRIVMLEPAMTLASSPFYRFVHQEPVDVSADPFAEGTAQIDRDPYDANIAVPSLIEKNRDRFQALFPDLHITEATWFSMFVYPLSGGFKSWSLVPASLVHAALNVERRLERLIGRLFGFRILLVIEKK